MKRLLTILLGLITSLGCLFACACAPKIEGTFSVVAPDGAPALAIAKFINDGEDFDTDATFNYSVVSSTAINGAIVNSAADFVVMPVNAATKLYTNNGKEDYYMAAVLTHGNFYVMSKSDIDTPQDLIGRVVFVPNRGKVPDWTFKAALKGLGIEYVDSDQPVSGKVAIKYFESPAQFNPQLIANPQAVGLVPEPAVSVLKGKGVNVVLDLQVMFDQENAAYPQAVLMVKKSVADKYPNLIEKMAAKFNDNVTWVKTNPSAAVQAVKGKFETSTLNAETITTATIDGCKISWQSAKDAKAQVNAYIERIREVNPAAASVVTDQFFYQG